MVTRKPIPAKPRRKAAKTLSPTEKLIRDLVAIGKRAPKDALAKLPRDLAENFDHYHDGSPRQL